MNKLGNIPYKRGVPEFKREIKYRKKQINSQRNNHHDHEYYIKNMDKLNGERFTNLHNYYDTTKKHFRKLDKAFKNRDWDSVHEIINAFNSFFNII